MKKVLLTLVLLGSFFAHAEEFKITGTNQAIVSKYIWRGISFNQKPVHQGSIDAEFGKIAVNFWFNRDLRDENGAEGAFTEYDFTVSYGGNLSKGISYDTGIILYQFQGLGGDTDEFYFGVTFDNVPLTPSITLNYDYLQTHLYFSFAAEYGFKIGSVDANIGFSLGLASGDYFDFYLGDSVAVFEAADDDADDDAVGTGFTDFALTFGISKELYKNLTLSASLSYTSLIGDAIINEKECDKNDENITFALDLGYSL